MLPEKLESMRAAWAQLVASEDTTPRLITSVRGKALHYACAIPFVAVAAPSLSQLMHDRERGTGPVKVPSLAEEQDMEFDWDGRMSRTRSGDTRWRQTDDA